MNKIPKTIVMVLPDLKGNGAERVALNLADGFINKGHDVYIILFKRKIELKSNSKLNILIFQHNYRWIPRAIRGSFIAPILDRFIVKNCGIPDLVLSNLLPVDRLLCKSKLNTYSIIHSNMSGEMLSFNRSKNSIEKIYSRMHCICVSQGTLKDFKKIFKTKLNINYIYNPVDVNYIKKESDEFMPAHLNYLINVGKFTTAKRHDILIKAYHASNVKNPLILIGQGPLENKYRELVSKLDLNNKIIFVGFKSNPYPLIKNAKLMIISSELEGLGMVILESLALGIPVISTDCKSGPGEILPQKNLCPVNDIKALSELIIKASINPKDYQVKLNDKFSIDVATQKYLNLIKPIVTNRALKHYRFSKTFAWINRHLRSRRGAINKTKNLYKKFGLVSNGCSLCKGVDFQLLAEGDRYGFDLNKQICNQCGLVQTYPSLSSEFHQEFYSYHYRPLYLKNKKVDYRSVIKEQTDKANKYLQYFKNNGLNNILKEISIIEIGCSSAGTINALKPHVKSVQGCDLDIEAITFAKENFKINVEVGMYPSTLPKGKKLFIMSHVLEHVFNPLETLAEVRGLLEAGDYLFVAVPGINQVAQGDYKNDLRRYFHIAHVTDFTGSTLVNVAHCAGFKTLSIDEEINGLFVSDKVQDWKKDPQDSIDNILKIENTYKGSAPHL